MKTAIFITIRIDSSRLPNKTLKKILGKTVFEHVINRAKQARGFDDIIVCTTNREIDNTIVKLAQMQDVHVFRGSLQDKLERWQGAAKYYNIDYIVTFDGDDLFCEPHLLEKGSQQIKLDEFDFIEAPKDLICGAFTYAFNVKALNKVCEIKDSKDTEMMWTYFKDTGLFRVGTLKNVESIYFNKNIRATLDYSEDFEFFTKVFEHFKCVNNDVPLKSIVEYLNENPEITRINIEKQQEFLDNQLKKTKLILKSK